MSFFDTPLVFDHEFWQRRLSDGTALPAELIKSPTNRDFIEVPQKHDVQNPVLLMLASRHKCGDVSLQTTERIWPEDDNQSAEDWEAAFLEADRRFVNTKAFIEDCLPQLGSEYLNKALPEGSSFVLAGFESDFQKPDIDDFANVTNLDIGEGYLYINDTVYIAREKEERISSGFWCTVRCTHVRDDGMPDQFVGRVVLRLTTYSYHVCFGELFAAGKAPEFVFIIEDFELSKKVCFKMDVGNVFPDSKYEEVKSFISLRKVVDEYLKLSSLKGDCVFHGTLAQQPATAATVDVAYDRQEQRTLIDPTEAAWITHELWATDVECRLADSERGKYETSAKEQTNGFLAVVILCFNRHSADFYRAVMALTMVQDLMTRGIDVEPPWANGAKILVDGVDASILDEAHVDLGPRHIVVRCADEHLILEAFKSLPCRSRPRLKPTSGRVELLGDGDVSLFAGSSSAHSSFFAIESQSSSSLDHDLGESVLVGEATAMVDEIFVHKTFIHIPLFSHTPRTCQSAP